MIRKIVGATDPVLRNPCREIGKVDKKIKRLIADMKETLDIQKDPEGVAIAAPQIGKGLKIFVAKYEGQELVAINPEIVKISKTKTTDEEARKTLEGCLSVPHYYSPILRSKRVRLKYLDENGNKQEKDFEGFWARIVQHETDHLKGVLFTDHVLAQRKPLYKVQGEDWEEVEI